MHPVKLLLRQIVETTIFRWAYSCWPIVNSFLYKMIAFFGTFCTPSSLISGFKWWLIIVLYRLLFLVCSLISIHSNRILILQWDYNRWNKFSINRLNGLRIGMNWIAFNWKHFYNHSNSNLLAFYDMYLSYIVCWVLFHFISFHIVRVKFVVRFNSFI